MSHLPRDHVARRGRGRRLPGVGQSPQPSRGRRDPDAGRSSRGAARRHGGLIVQPGYMSQAPQLVSSLVEAAGARGCQLAQTYLAACDHDKQQAAERAGFQREAILDGGCTPEARSSTWRSGAAASSAAVANTPGDRLKERGAASRSHHRIKPPLKKRLQEGDIDMEPTITVRQRLLAALERKETDRMPINLYGVYPHSPHDWRGSRPSYRPLLELAREHTDPFCIWAADRGAFYRAHSNARHPARRRRLR